MNQKTFDSMLLQRVSENPSDIFTFKVYCILLYYLIYSYVLLYS